ncbi:hypothetical protein BD560DRAFT_411104 [Blakeslea trispora]|nr:hypothetical protein BD560DRAFT_411104 [Blakeslea trispora]
MDRLIYFKIGQGNSINESGEDSMEVAEEVDPFKLEAVAFIMKYINLRNTVHSSEPEQEASKEEGLLIKRRCIVRHKKKGFFGFRRGHREE